MNRKRVITSALLALAVAGTTPASAVHAATPLTYGDFSGMFGRTAGQYFAGGSVAGQWTYAPQGGGVTDISWGDPAAWPPASAERFIRVGDWVELEGYSTGQGQPVTSPQIVTSESQSDAWCRNPMTIPNDQGRQHYVKWTVPGGNYCLDAAGYIATPTGTVHFAHRQVWSTPAPCANSYFAGRLCVTQREWWSDDNGAPFALKLDRTVKIAQGLGMAFTIHQSFPSTWDAEGRYYWSY